MAEILAIDAKVQEVQRKARISEEDQREDQILWSMMLDPDARKVALSLLTQDDLSIRHRKVVFRAVSHLEKVGTIDAGFFGVVELLKSKQALGEVPQAWFMALAKQEPLIGAGAMRVACQALKEYRRRKLASQTLQEISKGIVDPWQDPDALVRQAQSALSPLKRDSGIGRLSYKGNALEVDQVATLMMGGQTFTTGIRRLDFHLGGGFKRKHVMTLAAGSGAGKSTIAGRACRINAQAGHRVRILTSELDIASYHVRIVADLAGVPSYRMEEHVLGIKPFDLYEAERTNQALNILNEIDLEILGIFTSPEEVEAALVEESSDAPLDLVCLDLPEKLAPATNEAQSMIWDKCRYWANTFNCAFLGIAQWRTGMEARQGKEIPRVHWINYGKHAHKNSTQMVQIRIPGRGEQEEGAPETPKGEPEPAELIISKCSFPGRGHGERAAPIHVQFDGALARFVEVDEGGGEP